MVVEVGAAVRQIDGEVGAARAEHCAHAGHEVLEVGDVVHRHAGDHQVVRGAGANSAPATISRTSWMAEGGHPPMMTTAARRSSLRRPGLSSWVRARSSNSLVTGSASAAGRARGPGG